MINVCVVGGGFSGWLTAIVLKKECPKAKITLIDSPTVAKKLGVGESCPDLFLMWLMDHLKIPAFERSSWLREWLLETNAFIKYGVKWNGWLGDNDREFLTPFTPNGDAHQLLNAGLQQFRRPSGDAYKMSDVWYELFLQGRRNIEDFNRDQGDVYWTVNANKIPYYNDLFHNISNYTCQINTTNAADWFKKHYTQELDQVLEITIADFEVDEKDMVRSITDTDGNVHKYDLYIDCSGFKRLFGKKLDFKFNPGPTKVKHKSAVVTINKYNSEADIIKEMVPYTFFNTMKNGWRWEIPLLDSKSFGYVYDKEFITTEEAIDELTLRTGTDRRLLDPILVEWEPSWATEAWVGNVVTVGLSTGFLDPIDGNSIATQRLQIDHIMSAVNHPTSLKESRELYNGKVNRMFNDIALRKDVTFCLAPRNDTAYWQRNKTLYDKEELLNRCAERLNNNEFYGSYPLFYDNAWLVYFVYYGNDISRRCRKSSADYLDLADIFFKTKNQVGQARAKLMPNQVEWLKQIGADLGKIIS